MSEFDPIGGATPGTIVRGRVEWHVKFERDSRLYRIRGTSTLRDQPIGLALSATEVASLAELLDKIMREHRSNFRFVELRERPRT